MSDSTASDATIMNAAAHEAVDELDAAASSAETPADFISHSGLDECKYQQRKRVLQEQLQLLDICKSTADTRAVLLRIAAICKPPGGYADHVDMVNDEAFSEFIVAAFDLEMRTKLIHLLLKARQGNASEDDVIMYDVTVVLPVMRLVSSMFHCTSNAGGASNQKLATDWSGMLEIVLNRMLTVSDTATFSSCLEFVQNSFNNEDCGGGGGDRQLEPVARELVDKCLFMLNLASDEADDAACATILRFVIKLLDEQTPNGRRMRVITPLISKVLYAVCALLLRSGDGAAYLQVVELGLVCILKLVDSLRNYDLCRRTLVDAGYVPLIVTFVTHERDVIRHSALAILAQLPIDEEDVTDFVLCQLLTRLAYCVRTDDETISRVLDTIENCEMCYASGDMFLCQATDFHLMPYVMTLLESHNCETVNSSLKITEAVVDAQRKIKALSLSNKYVIKILQLFTARLEEETHQNLGTDMSTLEVFNETCLDVLSVVQQSLNDNVCVPEDEDVIATACLKRLRTNLKSAAKHPVLRDLFCLIDYGLSDWLSMITDVLKRSRAAARLTTTTVKSDRVLRSRAKLVKK